ncbi:DNA alkylation repair protein [Limibacter armeniacum]|uniref:DNA alkylation repair protein n=1 Tax=Limibacter armeniacum TaxID=466084 RepID=UPI002FE51D51
MNYPIEALISQMRENANPNIAPSMKTYMKEQFEFFGIKSPERNALLKHFIETYGQPDYSELEEVVKVLWNQHERECQYVALELAKKQKRHFTIESLSWFEWMIVNKSWWDTVDAIASHLVGALFKRYPELVYPTVEKWMVSDNMWLKRTCLIFQLKYGKTTDEDLLFSCVQDLREVDDFFIRKAIGWALRQYAKTAPNTVVDFVARIPLKPLSEKEALKHIRSEN